MLSEISFELLEKGQQNRLAVSPKAVCAWSDEDFAGRVSRAAKSCHGAAVCVECVRPLFHPIREIGCQEAQESRDNV